MSNIGKVIKQQRVMSELTLKQLSQTSSVSLSHLGRVERGERFPSGHILRKIASPLGFSEVELLTTAGYLSPQSAIGDSGISTGRLDPYVARVLSEEPGQVQRTVVALLTILKNIAGVKE